MKVCEKHEISYTGRWAECPVCRFERLLDDREKEIKELKQEIHDLVMKQALPDKEVE